MDVREDRTLLADTPLRAVAYAGTILRGNGGDDRVTAKRARAHSCEVVRVAR